MGACFLGFEDCSFGVVVVGGGGSAIAVQMVGQILGWRGLLGLVGLVEGASGVFGDGLGEGWVGQVAGVAVAVGEFCVPR